MDAKGCALMAGLFLVTLATLALEILLTRIFSVTLWYHFAFAAISVAMAGMTAGAIVVYAYPRWFSPERVYRALGASALLFGLSVVVTLSLHLAFLPATKESEFLRVMGTMLLMTAPFFFSGVCVSVALTRFPGLVCKLYAVDLVGAAVGCVAVVLALSVVDAIYACFAFGLCAAVAALFFLWREPARAWRWTAVASVVLLALLTVAGVVDQVRVQMPFRIAWAKGFNQRDILYERWNSFSRIAITHADVSKDPVAWSLSAHYDKPIPLMHDWLMIDAWAGTPLIHFNGDLIQAEFLKYDVTNFAHHLRTNASVLIVGSGGGREILSALAFNQERVVAVEMNDAIVDAVTNRFGAQLGNLHRNPKVTLVHDEARSFITRQTERFDILQLSFVDTFAATAAGAFVLAENSLYTVEGWEVFLRHLSDDGLLSVSRAATPAARPELYRLVSLARESLGRIGAAKPDRHVLVVANFDATRPPSWGPMANVLVSRRPLTDQDIDKAEAAAVTMGFTVLVKPGTAADEYFAAVVSGRGLVPLQSKSLFNLDAPTDDSPFFFNTMRISDWFTASASTLGNPNVQAISVVMNLLGALLVLTLVTLLVPLRRSAATEGDRRTVPQLLFFTSIGFGFMLVEVSQMQRLTIFLGHPVYGITVILFVLLSAAGAGSRLVAAVRDEALGRTGIGLMAGLLAVVAVFGVAVPPMLSAFVSLSTPMRVCISALALAPLGLGLGMAFPLGMRVAQRSVPRLTPWLWGVNGAASVSGSVLAVVVALGAGITASYWLGATFYLVALVAYRSGQGAGAMPIT